jgi:shikimate dehydrogenase
VDVKGKTVVVLGAGGAARAAALALRRKGGKVTVLARDAAQAGAVGKAVGCAHAPLDDLAHRAWDVLINATPVGSPVAPGRSLVPAHLHRPGSVVLDMVYDPLETPLLREAAAAGCAVIDGVDMLVAQAVAQFETWTGTEAPVEVMRSAALTYMEGSKS